MGKPWIAVDFDRTLATYESGLWPDIGQPIPEMVERVKEWIAQGKKVKIFTARVDDLLRDREYGTDYPSNDYVVDVAQRMSIELFCLEHIGVILTATNRKDFDCEEIWDDKAVQVVPNVGARVINLT